MLFANQPDNVAPDFYSRGSLSDNRGTLSINSFSQGNALVYDLREKTSLRLERKFINIWPYWGIARSPDGKMFWHNHRLYDVRGTEVASLERKELSTGPFWSPDSRYSVYPYALDDSPDNWMDGGDIDVLAPQAFILMDRAGKPVQAVQAEQPGMHVELAGWLPDRNEAVLQYYRLNRKKPVNEQKQEIAYKILSIETGQLSELKSAELEQFEQVDRVMKGIADEPVFFVDRKKGLYWHPERPSVYIGELNQGELVWRIDAYSHLTSQLYIFCAADKKVKMISVKYSLLNNRLYLNRWAVRLVYPNRLVFLYLAGYECSNLTNSKIRFLVVRG
ncbi:hypothetical protein [Ferviditalea candida]|uniref:Protein TolB n=1 Tax=Ferviditalea candida TaxID=3108399 RepID=A0ABU5ZGC6_9BACL|nr:hypothetical protein [Paenibacillaceae bacterium T2]